MQNVTISSKEIQYECWIFIPSINILVIKRTIYLLFDRLYNCVRLIFMCYIDVVYRFMVNSLLPLMILPFELYLIRNSCFLIIFHHLLSYLPR